MMNDTVKNLLIWLVVLAVIFFIFNSFNPRELNENKISYTDFIQSVQKGDVSNVLITDQAITGTTKSTNKSFSTTMPMSDPFLMPELLKKNVNATIKLPEQESLLIRFLISWGPVLLIIGAYFYMMRHMQGGGKGGAFGFGRSRAKLKSLLPMWPVVKKPNTKSVN